MYYNAGKLERENVPAGEFMRFMYENPVGRATLPFLIKRKFLSRIYGAYCRTGFSVRNVPKFIREHNIDMAGCKAEFSSYADFFSREKVFAFPQERDVLFAPCEGLACVYENIKTDSLIAAKDSHFSLAELFQDERLAAEYADGTMLKIRLTPANYHRMHFFDDGKIVSEKFVDGHLYSVNPIAVSRIIRLYCQNKRAIFEMETEQFGRVAVVEVGATFVGSIVHLFEVGKAFSRGETASYFLPGGSLVLIFFQKGIFSPKDEILAHTQEGYETKISVGEEIGVKI
ncbi:MAG: phosphatidylserine decarboxylase [Turicibacter sp.]|nr:phosphatidylserine decarboxylase [Turicibacter sp.]